MAATKSIQADGERLARTESTIYWRDTELVEPGRPLRGEVRCDVCIVGGGYTGMWTAYFLKRADPSIDIHILEADYAGAGASGHNDGFITPTIGHSLWTLVHGFGAEMAKTAYAVAGRSILEIGRFCGSHHIDAELEPNGFCLVATNKGQLVRLERDLDLAEQLGTRNALTLLRDEEAQATLGSPAVLAALKTSAGALVNPHRLARGLARVLREEGVHLHEGTRALTLTPSVGATKVSTPKGTVKAERVVLATNAYQHQFAPFRKHIKPVWSYAMVSRPLTDRELEQVHWPGREGFVEARNFIIFARLTADNRLLIGGGPAPYHYGCDMRDRHITNVQVTRALRQALSRYFPPWRDLHFTHVYGGCIAITRDLIPHVGDRGDGTYYAHGYCGNGIAMTHAAGKALRDLILDRESSYTQLLFVNGREPAFPPEPLAFLAARGLSKVLAWQDRCPPLSGRQIV